MSKYSNTNPLEKLHEGEPFFFLRAQDKLAPAIVLAYAEALEMCGDAQGSMECSEIAEQMINWQEANPDKIKLPD